jgi:hypothetical protein
MLLVRLVIVGATIVIVPLIALLLNSVSVSNLMTCIYTMDDIMQVWWCDAASRVPTGTVLVVIFMTPVFVLLVMDWILYSCYV